jgi:heme exporter protein A
LTCLARNLIAEDLACRRGERLVFTGVSFRLSEGGALLLTGANGSGKTSLLRLLATLIPLAGGRLFWGAAPFDADVAAYRAALQYVGDQDAVKPGLTPRETLLFWAVLRGAGVSRRLPLLDEALAAFALEAVADWPCRWLSAGQRRRLAIARLVVSPASIWLLDEPTSGLDRDNQLRLERVIAEHRASGGRVVVASHTPIDIPAADVVLLDAFAPSPDHVAVG